MADSRRGTDDPPRRWPSSARRQQARDRTARQHHSHEVFPRGCDRGAMGGDRRGAPSLPAVRVHAATGCRLVRRDAAPDAIAEADTAATDCDLFLCVGTSAVVYRAAGLPFAAVRSGAVLVEVKPSETALTCEATYSLRGPSGRVLPALVKAVWGEGRRKA